MHCIMKLNRIIIVTKNVQAFKSIAVSKDQQRNTLIYIEV
ncbi:hypothetical protein BA6E_12499 [Bacteroidales bacterium 6E]|nr:hypothetical protein BA6E_12499 [Bacteroidales bacterium 6E]